MIASRQEASDLLNKWFEERTAVKALVTFAGSPFAVSVSGFVNGITSEILISDGPSDLTVRPANYILMPTIGVHQYEYLESKDLGLSQELIAAITEAHGKASLSVVFSSGLRLSVFEKQ
jgi:hypothetical protein